MGKPKIMMVDDDRDFLELTSALLKDNGYEVETAASGEEAREKALDVLPELIILDVMMETDMAGIETARWLRSQKPIEKTPIIMLTAVNQEVSFNFGPDDVWLPVDEFLEKPVTGEKLLAEVKQKLPSKEG